MRKDEVWYKEYLQAIPRIVLAVLIALVISKPLELKIFQKEIATELIILQEEITNQQHEKIETRFDSKLASILSSTKSLKNEIAQKELKRDELFLLASNEADGTGGSGKKNLGPIYKIKQEDALRVEHELGQLTSINTRTIERYYQEIDKINEQKNLSISILGTPDVSGFSFQLTALNRLGERYTTTAMSDYFIILHFIALELAPIITKLISTRGPYDDLLKVHEHHFKNYRKEKTSIADVLLERKLASF